VLEAPVECDAGKSQSKPLPKDPSLDSPATDNDNALNELIADAAAATSVVGFRRLSLLNQMLGEGLIQ
jgi:hypothetical protein